MPSSGVLWRVALVNTDVSEECIIFISEKRMDQVGTMLAVTENRRMLSFVLS
jgi:hypothetical protein